MSFRDFVREAEESQEVGFVTDIEKDTVDNDKFRKSLFTGDNMQLVLMSLKPNEDIGEEIHDPDQFFRIDGGSGKLVMDGKEYDIKDGSAFIVPGGVKHNIIAGEEGIKLYAIYSPPQHPEGTVHDTKEEAMEDEGEE